MKIIRLFGQPGDLGLNNFTLEAAQLNFGVHTIHFIFEFCDSCLEIFHLILDFADCPVEGLFFGLILSFSIFKNWLETFLFFELWC